MKTFGEYLDKMGYSWNDFDRTYEMENLIEQYADETVKQALTIPAVVKSFTAEEVVNELEDCDTLDDAIMFFKENK